MDAGWVVRKVLRQRSKLSRMQIFGEDRMLQKGEQHLPRAGRQLKEGNQWRGAIRDWTPIEPG